jgi:hypothetical protein
MVAEGETLVLRRTTSKLLDNLVLLEHAGSTAVPLVDGQTNVEYKHVTLVQTILVGWHLDEKSEEHFSNLEAETTVESP